MKRIRKRTTNDQKIIFCKRDFKIASGRKTKALCRNMENTDKKIQKFCNLSRGYKIPFLKKPA